MLDLLNEDGPVQGIDCGGVVSVVASESPWERLTEEGVKWEFANGVKKAEDSQRHTMIRGAEESRKVLRHFQTHVGFY